MSIQNTGVHATAKELAEARLMACMVATTPADLHYEERETMMQQIDAWALAHGLPKLPDVDGKPDHYGLNADGEFTRYVRDGVDHVEVP
jgi:hypothetical protein